MNLKLNIGCGRDYRPGWENIDVSKEVKTDRRVDIRKDYLPYDENDADLIYISGVLEQIGSNDELIFALNECHRVLKIGGTIEIIVPNAKYSIAHRDPMDVRKFTPETFPYFISDSQEYELYGSVYGFCPWMNLQIRENERHIMTVTMEKCGQIK